jgi:predicted CoA-binding protein
MTHVTALITDFLRGRRIDVAGVSRGTGNAANLVFRKLRASGYDVFPVNPNASELEGARCFPNLESVPGELDGVVVATHPDDRSVVRQAVERRVSRAAP